MYRHIIQSSIEYIENNLCSELTAKELSERAGFSLFHYYRLFTSIVGIPVMQYITRRRLLYAVYEMSKGMKKADAALMYGFDTYAGFYKAFLREFGCTPSFYLSNFMIIKPYKINILQEEPVMVSHKQITELLSMYWKLEDVTIKDVVYEGTGKKSDSLYYVGGKYALKFSTSLGKLKNHIKISEALEKEGLLAATPVETHSGEKYVQYGQLYCCLTKHIQGQQILPQNLFNEDVKGDGFAKWIEIYKEIMYGYDTVAKLSDDERKAIPYVVLSNQFLATAWFAEQDKYRDVYEVNKLMTKSIVENFDMLLLQA